MRDGWWDRSIHAFAAVAFIVRGKGYSCLVFFSFAGKQITHIVLEYIFYWLIYFVSSFHWIRSTTMILVIFMDFYGFCLFHDDDDLLLLPSVVRQHTHSYEMTMDLFKNQTATWLGVEWA